MKSNLSALFDKAKKVTLVNVPVQSDSEPVNQPIEQKIPLKLQKTTKLEHEPRDLINENIRTIFIGNIPSECTQKELKKLFSQFGQIETIRLRNLIPLNAKQGKRIAFIKKEYHPIQKTINAFIRFNDENQAENATSLNGFLYKEHHLRVNMAHEQHEEPKHDNKRSIFIGNLPFDTSDDDVWQVFEECGQIESVRLIRDSATSVGKGFGYVLFHDEASVTLALRMNGNCKIGNREIRIKPSVKKPKSVKLPINRRKSREYNENKIKLKKVRHVDHTDGVKQGRVEKRPSVKLRKEKQKKISTIKTNNLKKDVIQLKRKS